MLDVYYHGLYNAWCTVQFYWSTTPLTFVLARVLQPKYYINSYIYLSKYCCYYITIITDAVTTITELSATVGTDKIVETTA